MIRNGKYTAWFRTPHGQGTGVVHLADGSISGSDSFFVYGGCYRLDGNRFTATLTTRRYADGPPTVFGLDEVDVELAGVWNGSMATCTGTARQAPDVHFEATLFYSDNEASPPDTKCAIVKLKPDKLPKGLDGRSRSRLSFAPGTSKTSAS